MSPTKEAATRRPPPIHRCACRAVTARYGSVGIYIPNCTSTEFLMVLIQIMQVIVVDLKLGSVIT